MAAGNLFRIVEEVWKKGQDVFDVQAQTNQKWLSQIQTQLGGQAQFWLGSAANAEKKQASELVVINIKRLIDCLEQMAALYPDMKNVFAKFEDDAKSQFSKFS